MSLLQYTRLIIATGLLSVGLSSEAAVVHIVDNGQLIGATGVEVDGALYDVAFTDGSFESLYPSGIPAFHANVADATLFSQALLDTVFIDLGTASTAFDSQPGLTNGCENDICEVVTPYFIFDDRTFFAVTAQNNAPPFPDFTPTVPGGVLRTLDTAIVDRATFAVFTPVAAIPEPSTYAMLAAGLLILAGFSRRSNRV